MLDAMLAVKKAWRTAPQQNQCVASDCLDRGSRMKAYFDHEIIFSDYLW